MDDTAIRALIERLARPRAAGGQEIERAAILAAGADAPAVVAWILAHDGAPEQEVATPPRRGLHGAQLADATAKHRAPQRFVLPAGVLGEQTRPGRLG
ncbi:MAG TPA: hypothetical protein VLP43_08155 [Solirubrobacteraceae bacterium]|nr:hypothetical protein [Solirubrobacteraceae bacterium]